MAVQVIWLLFSYAFLFAIGAGLYSSGYRVVGLVFIVLLPLLRVCLRFSKSGGYRMIGVAGQVNGNIGERGGYATRSDHRILFWFAMTMEFAVLIGFSVHFLHASL